MWFKIVGDIHTIQIIARGRHIRELSRLKKFYGRGRWRKLKGIALVDLSSGQAFQAEVHWYEAHGISLKEFKIKRFIKNP